MGPPKTSSKFVAPTTLQGVYRHVERTKKGFNAVDAQRPRAVGNAHQIPQVRPLHGCCYVGLAHLCPNPSLSGSNGSNRGLGIWSQANHAHL